MDLRQLKKQAKVDFKDVPGITGFGIGDQVLRVYIANPSLKLNFPDEYRGVPLEFVLTNDVVAQKSKRTSSATNNFDVKVCQNAIDMVSEGRVSTACEEQPHGLFADRVDDQ